MKKKFLPLLALLTLLTPLNNSISSRVEGFIEREYAVALSEYKIEDFSSEYSVTSPSGKQLSTNGTFVLTELGVYKIYKNGALYKEITVLYEPFPVSINLEKEIVSEINTNRPVTIPKARLYSNIEEFDSYNINIEKNEEIIDSFENVSSEFVYSFSKGGNYDICYVVTDTFGFEVKKSYQISVLSHNEIINLDYPTEWAVLSTIDFSKVSGLSEGVSYDVDISLKDPNNAEVELVNNTFTFTKEGTYTANFSCDFNGEIVEEQLAFNVELSEASYFSNGKNIVSVTKNENTDKKKGLEIKADGTGSYIYYNKAINLKDFTADDELVNFFVLYDDESDMQDIRVSLIDANDENNYFSVYWKRSKSVGWEHITYCLAEFNGYAVGVSNETGKNFGELRETYGAMLTCSLAEQNNGVYPFNFTYSQEENAVYLYRTAGGATSKILLVDFDDKDLLGNYSPWNGFSSDNVYLKFDFIDNVKSKIRVTDIDGKNLLDSSSNVKDDEFLTFNYLEDNFLKTNDIHINSYANHLTKLPVPNTNNLIYGDVDVETKLFFKNQSVYEELNAQIDDYKFTPTTSGEYKVVYSYIDIYGKDQSVEIEFTCKGENPDDIDIHFEGKDTSVSSLEGEYLTYFNVPNISVDGGVGNLKRTVTYKLNGETEIFPDENNEFYLNKKGYIDIDIHVVDDIGQVKSRSLRININSNIQRIELIEEPKSFFAGRQVYLKDFEAYDYTVDEGNAGYKLAKSVYLDDVEINDMTFICPTNKDTVKLTYYGGKGTPKEVKKEVIVKVVPANDDNITILSELFDGIENATTSEMFSEGYAVKMNSDLSINYVNPLVSRSFNLGFYLVEGKTNFDSLKLKLTDYQHENGGSLTVELKITSFDHVEFWLNGEKANELPCGKGKLHDGLFVNANYADYSINLLEYIKLFATDSNEAISNIVKNDNGRIFKGFESGLLNLEISTTNTQANSGLVIKTISNQTFSTNSIYEGSDSQRPVIGTLSEFKKVYSFNENANLPIAVASDVLQGRTDYVDLTVTTPSGRTLTFDGTVENNFTFDEYGEYNFVYKTEDYYENKATYRVLAYVYDEVKPVITVNDIINSTMHVGDTITLGNYTVTDNIGVTVKAVYIYTPQSEIIEVSGSYKFTYKGKYKVIYYARDARGNFTKIVYNISVE